MSADHFRFAMRRIYLSGPMAGCPNGNFRAFDFAADKLRMEHYEVFSPADGDRKMMVWPRDYVPLDSELEDAMASGKLPYRKRLMADLVVIMGWADTIAVLPRWQKSVGVDIELRAARAIGLNEIFLGKVYDYAAD